MHEEKISFAFNAIKQPQNIFNQDITVVDWGCGQGLATVCFFDYLNQKQLPNKTRKVILIEPSESALNRAKLHVAAYLKDTSNILLKNKFIDGTYTGFSVESTEFVEVKDPLQEMLHSLVSVQK